MIARLIAWLASRDEDIERMIEANAARYLPGMEKPLRPLARIAEENRRNVMAAERRLEGETT